MHFLTTAILTTLSAALPSALAANTHCAGSLTDPSSLAACADQLALRAGETCSVVGGFTKTFCQIGGAAVVGVGVGSPSGRETSTDCGDLAIAVGHILDKCTENVGGVGWRAAGNEAAPNNPDIVVHAVSNFGV